MEKGEAKIRQEDCHEDSIGPGILTLTNRRLAFDETKARIASFSKNVGDTVIDVSLKNVTRVWKEGWFMKKFCFSSKIENEEKIFKFGVFNSGSWLKSVQKAIDEYKSQ